MHKELVSRVLEARPPPGRSYGLWNRFQSGFSHNFCFPLSVKFRHLCGIDLAQKRPLFHFRGVHIDELK